MNILSLFDGMSCGQLALNRIGIKYDNYFASEVDKHAIKVTQINFPNTIQIGDVTKVKFIEGILKTENGNYNIGKIDLLIGGSPCQGFSFSGRQLNFEDPRSKLFFEYERILKEIQSYNPDVKYLLENVRMRKDFENVISNRIGIEPIFICSSNYTAQSRKRLYWTNIEGVEEEKSTTEGLLLSDVLEENVDPKYIKKAKRYNGGDRLNPDYKSQANTVYTIDRKSPCLSAFTHGYALGYIKIENEDGVIIRMITPIEWERLQTVPENYTNYVSDTQRYKMLGNGWTIDVIANIFKKLIKNI